MGMDPDMVRAFGDGDLIASSTLQEGLEVFETSFGAWAYKRVWGMDITLGGPLCSPSDRGEMIQRFLSASRRPILFYLREPLMAALEGCGLHGAGIGVDRHVDTEALLDNPASAVRGALKKARKAGLRLDRLDLRTLAAPTRRRLDEITARYLACAECTIEMRFINRPMSYEADGLRRIYLLSRSDAEPEGPFGYAVLNPIFEGGRATRYLLDILRFEPTRLWGVWLASVHTLTEQLAVEGLGLSVGFSPLHKVQRPAVGASDTLQAQVEWMVERLSSAQYLRRLRELKDLIPGPEEPRFMASFTRFAPAALFAFMEALGVGFGYLFGPDLIKVLREGYRHKKEALV